MQEIKNGIDRTHLVYLELNKSDATYCSQKLKIRFSMKNSLNSSAQQPMIVKYVEALHNGIQSQALSRYAIGYILRGTKYIYEGDKRQTLTRGDVFYLGIGHHYIENFPENGQPFEQVLFTIRRRTSSVS